MTDWIQLVVAAATGALGASLINAAFELARDSRAAKREHERWLRDRRMNAALTMIAGMDIVTSAPDGSVFPIQDVVRSLTAVHLNGPDSVRGAARTTRDAFNALDLTLDAKARASDPGFIRWEANVVALIAEVQKAVGIKP